MALSIPPPPPDRPLAAGSSGRKPWHILGENGWRILTENLHEATVLNDNTVRLGGTIVLDIPPRPRGRSWAGTRVEVRQLLDGTWRVYSGDRLVATGAATTHGELPALLHRRKRGRGAPTPPPVHASLAEARPRPHREAPHLPDAMRASAGSQRDLGGSTLRTN